MYYNFYAVKIKQIKNWFDQWGIVLEINKIDQGEAKNGYQLFNTHNNKKVFLNKQDFRKLKVEEIIKKVK